MNTVKGTTVIQGCNSDRSLDVNIQDQVTTPVGLYLHTSTNHLTLSANAAIDDEQITVADSSGISANQVIDIYEEDRFFQSIVLSITDNNIILASPLDYDFTTDAVIHTGDWNLAKDGSTTPIKAYIHPPSNANFDIYTINVNIQDQTEMDSAKFGGIASLNNGMLFRIHNHKINNMPFIRNNSGFQEIGFSIQYDSKAPAGYYGMAATKNWHEKNGVAIRLRGIDGVSDEFQLWIRDDLTGLDLLCCTVLGHVVEY